MKHILTPKYNADRWLRRMNAKRCDRPIKLSPSYTYYGLLVGPGGEHTLFECDTTQDLGFIGCQYYRTTT